MLQNKARGPFHKLYFIGSSEHDESDGHENLHPLFISIINPFYIASYYIKWVTTSWIYSILQQVQNRPEIIEPVHLIGPSLVPMK